MNKLFYALVAVCMLAAVANAVLCPTVAVNKSGPSCVVADCYRNTIATGIGAVVENGTVTVCDGTYYESVTISKAINLIGESMDAVISGDSPGIEITADHVNVSKFYLEYWTTGIYVNGADYAHVTDIELDDMHSGSESLQGIWLSDSNYARITDIDFGSIDADGYTTYGIRLEGSDYNYFDPITFDDISSTALFTTYGIYLDDSSYNQFFDMEFSDLNGIDCSAYGIYAVDDSNENNFTRTTFGDINGTYAAGVHFDGEDANVDENRVTGLTLGAITGLGGAAVFDLYLADNNVFDPITVGPVTSYSRDTIETTYGIRLEGSDDNSFKDINFTDLNSVGSDTYGIYADYYEDGDTDYSDDNTFTRIKFGDLNGSNTYGVYTEEAYNLEFRDLTFGSITGEHETAGFYLIEAQHDYFDPISFGPITSTEADLTTYGIYLAAGSEDISEDNEFNDITFSDLNSIGSDTYGIYLTDESADNNFTKIKFGTFNGTDVYGVAVVDDSESNRFKDMTLGAMTALDRAAVFYLEGADNNIFDPITVGPVTSIGGDATTYGIYLNSYSSGNVFDRITFSDLDATNSNAYGIHAYSSSNRNNFTNLHFSGITAKYNAYGVYISDSRDNRLANSVFGNIWANETSSASAYGMYITSGLVFDDSSTTASNNHFGNIDAAQYGTGSGIYITGASYSNITGTTFGNLTGSAGTLYGVMIREDNGANNRIDGLTMGNIDTAGASSEAAFIYVRSGAAYNVINNAACGDITSDSMNAYGIRVWDKSHNNFTHITTGDINGGSGAYGIRAQTSVYDRFDGITIGDVTSSSGSAYGVSLLAAYNDTVSNFNIGDVTDGFSARAVGVSIDNPGNNTVRDGEIGDITSNFDRGQAYGVFVGGGSLEAVRDIRFGDISAPAGNGSAYGIYNIATEDSTFSNLRFGTITASPPEGLGALIYDSSSEGNTFTSIRSKQVSGTGAAMGIYGVYLGSSNSEAISNIRMSGLHATSGPAQGIRLDPRCGSNTIRDINTGPITADSNIAAGVFIAGGYGGTPAISGNLVDGFTTGAISSGTDDTACVRIEGANNWDNVLNEVHCGGISGPAQYGLMSTGATDNLLANSTLPTVGAGNDSVYLSGGNITLLNTTLERDKVDVSSLLTVQWYVDFVTYVGGLGNIGGVEVNLTDAGASQLFSEVSDSGGLIARKEITEFTQNASGRTAYTPHHLTGFKAGYKQRNITLNVVESMTVGVIMTPEHATPGGDGYVPPTPTPTPVPTQTPIWTPTPHYTPAPSPTVTQTPQPTQTPAPSPSGQGDAQNAINDAQAAIDQAGAAGKDTGGASGLLEQARNAFESGNYDEAVRLANAARDAANNAPPAQTPTPAWTPARSPVPTATPAPTPAPGGADYSWLLWIIGGIVLLAIVIGGIILLGGGAWFLGKKRK